jgi:Cu2+-exporting ATPase
MVGDGLNDAPAMAAAHASMAPANAADIGRQSADIVFLHNGLDAVPFAIRIARQASRPDPAELRARGRLQRGRHAARLAGLLTPLIAALAMSGSSLLVVANALRFPATAGQAGARAAPTRARAGPA